MQIHLPTARVVSSPRSTGDVQVLHLRDERGRAWYANRLIQPALFDAEMRGYELWGDLRFVPSPVTVDPRTRCLLLPGLPGRQPPGDSARVLIAAGRRLRSMHDLPPSAGWVDEWQRETRRQMRNHLARLHSRGVPLPVSRIRRAVRQLVSLDELPLAATHGDFQPHNWRWHARHRLFVFDFASAALRPAVHDFTRLYYAACWDRTPLFDAVVNGYGRPLSDVERRYLDLSLVVRAVVGLDLGLRQQQETMVAHAQRVLSDRHGQ